MLTYLAPPLASAWLVGYPWNKKNKNKNKNRNYTDKCCHHDGEGHSHYLDEHKK
jgi:hypothetical protein